VTAKSPGLALAVKSRNLLVVIRLHSTIGAVDVHDAGYRGGPQPDCSRLTHSHPVIPLLLDTSRTQE
jgi:hypothetical protein